jgi:phosphomannomutase
VRPERAAGVVDGVPRASEEHHLLIRSVSGVRGIAGEDITPDLAYVYGRAFADMAGSRVVVGWDSRPGGDSLKAAVESGLADGGVSVLDAGVVPTPTLGVAIRQLRLGGGVQVTASHNPEEYNGLKFFSGSGVFLEGEDVARLFAAVDAHVSTGPRNRRVGEASPDAEAGGRGEPAGDIVGRHIELVLASPFVDTEAIAGARPRVAVDCVNAAGAVLLPRLLRELGCEVVELYAEPGAGFARGPEPVPANLSALSEAVREGGAAVGMACDPDADRLALVDETGRAVGEEFTLALAVKAVLESRLGPVVVNASTSRMIDDVTAEFGVPLHRTAIGEINVVSKMADVGAVIGGEGNGGVILPDVHPGRDAATAAALVLAGAMDGGIKPLSVAVAGFTDYAMVKTKLRLNSPDRKAIVDAMTSEFPDGELDLTDGAKIAWPDRWIHARMSGTEPVVRVIAEARRREDADELIDRARSAVSTAAGGA